MERDINYLLNGINVETFNIFDKLRRGLEGLKSEQFSKEFSNSPQFVIISRIITTTPGILKYIQFNRLRKRLISIDGYEYWKKDIDIIHDFISSIHLNLITNSCEASDHEIWSKFIINYLDFWKYRYCVVSGCLTMDFHETKFISTPEIAYINIFKCWMCKDEYLYEKIIIREETEQDNVDTD